MSSVGSPDAASSAATLTATVVRPGAPVGPQTATTRPLPGTTSGASPWPGTGSSGNIDNGSASPAGVDDGGDDRQPHLLLALGLGAASAFNGEGTRTRSSWDDSTAATRAVTSSSRTSSVTEPLASPDPPNTSLLRVGTDPTVTPA